MFTGPLGAEFQLTLLAGFLLGMAFQGLLSLFQNRLMRARLRELERSYRNALEDLRRDAVFAQNRLHEQANELRVVSAGKLFRGGDIVTEALPRGRGRK